jgi:uncharacterized repeat protein (TIGR02059 family)
MTTNFIGVLLPNSPDFTVGTGFSDELYDAEGGQTIIVQPGASLVLVGAMGANTIKLSGSTHDWQVYRDGSTAILVNGDGSRVEIPAEATSQSMVFSDASLDLRVAVNGGSPAVMLGSQILDTTAAPIGGYADTNGSTQQSPWTLVMTDVGGVYTSDGSAAGSGYVLQKAGVYWAARPLVANHDHTVAVFAADQVYGTDGTAKGSVALYNGYVDQSKQPYVLGNKIVFPDNSPYYKSVVTNGTVAGTTVLDNIPNDLVDANSQTLWGEVQSTPYGWEMFKTVVTDSGAVTTMTKDVNPGTGDGVYGYQHVPMGRLPDGRVVFSGNDGHNTGPWISDGTDAGTYPLTDAEGDTIGYPNSFMSFGPDLAFTANVTIKGISKGLELVTTDGTRDGTHVFDVSPGYYSANPQLLGTVGGSLYFMADNYENGISTRAMFSTDGASVQKVVDIGSAPMLMGWANGKAFFKGNDPAHGDELWVADAAQGTFALVKDILPGTGSALAGYWSGNSTMVGNRIGFSAYVSPSVSAYFLSDGTAAGTWQIGSKTPTQIIDLGDKIFFTDSDGIHVVENNAGNAKVTLLSALGSAPIQTDADQAWFIAANGDLHATSGDTAGPVLEKNVAQFKVVAENAAFFIKTMADGSNTLWYSDGSVDGTRFIRTLPTSTFNLTTAVGLHTMGFPLPPDVTAPVLSFASVNGSKLTLSYTDDNALDSTHAPDASAFHLSGTAATVTAVAVDASARKVVLTLSEPVKSTDKGIVVSYTDPTTGNDTKAIQDSAGNDAATVTNWPVQNVTPDNVAPVLVSAAANGSILTLAYSDASPLDGIHLPASTAFSLQGTAATVSKVAVDSTGTKLVLTLSQPVLPADVIKISYLDPTSGNDSAAVQDVAGNDAASVSGMAVQNSTLAKAPWSLLVTAGNNLFITDGTPDGSKVIAQQLTSQHLYTSADHATALLLAQTYDSSANVTHNNAFAVDGSGKAPVLLSDKVAGPWSTVWVMGKEFVVSASGTLNGLVTDGTVAGSHLAPNLQPGLADLAHKAIWSGVNSAPYGTELFLTHVTDGGADTGMVKDVWPGPGNGYVIDTGIAPALLSNGKLLFAGNDGTNNAEPWVSDGTAAGTIPLADLMPGNQSSYPDHFVAFGDFAAFTAYMTDTGGNPLGRELVVTDGTVAGTKEFDLANGAYGSGPQFLGHAGGNLYFAAASNAGTSLYSTDGKTVTQLTQNNAGDFLGASASKVFFSVYDAVHGKELWAGDLGAGNLSMVKDILPGTGGALSGYTNATMVGDKLVFQAYTSPTTQQLFVSDGTADGTVQLGIPMTRSQTVGDHLLVYADGTHVYALDVSASTPAAHALVAGSAPGLMWGDADQAFFRMDNGDLYATDGTDAGTVELAQSVRSVKVAGENALYILQTTTDGTGYGLSYSDGTAQGTHFIGYVSVDVANAFDGGVTIQTIGVPPPGH